MSTFRGITSALAVLAVAAVGILGEGTATAGVDEIPTATVSGPVATSASSYPFLATDIDLVKYGYVEEEFFLEGNAYRYDTSGGPAVPATRIVTGGEEDDGLYPFKTRIVVRRPADPADANGVVVAEWNNVTSTQDVEFNWFGDPQYLLKHGYTFVGVTAQSLAVTTLKAFNNTRYGSLTVNGNGTVPTGTGLDGDALSYDVFSSVAKALKGGREGVDPLGGIAPDKVIASGESQSCGRLTNHYNKFEPGYDVIDGYLLTVCYQPALRADIPGQGEKAIRIMSETENRIPRTTANFPDTDSVRHWEVAGGSHLPRITFDNLNGVFTRDFAKVTAECVKFPLSIVKWPFTQNVAIRDLAAWSTTGTPPPVALPSPPIAPRGQYLAAPPDPTNQLERDEFGNAKGGIRYPDMEVPVATNDGINSAAPGGSLFSSFCGLFGSSTPFSPELLHGLYADQADYLAKYSDAADDLTASGFILAEDAERLKEDSRQYARLRPTIPAVIGRSSNRGNFQLSWVGTEAPDTAFALERRSVKGKAAWRRVKPKSIVDSTATMSGLSQGTSYFRVRSTTVLPATNISEPETVVTPFSEASVAVKVDRTGPQKPRIVVRGRKARGVFRGPVRVRVIGRPDRKLPDGSAGAGLNRKSVPKVRTIRKKGRTVIRVRTKDRLGNRSPVARAVIRIRK